ncbi:nicotinate-nicotinamide nucleotide adenylyltransferase [Psychrobacter sp. NZS113]|uniref:nicotinate-nicotinamide nucleotide adenylyltransferase n=1 Tax=Psychrobacter sp. NZS113 TaxID=2792045 RepID=UPI001D111F37|nr:nicotinate-nicotinamide nucleotide adenylyltransferase [Psychrobacter sp. NZS113]
MTNHKQTQYPAPAIRAYLGGSFDPVHKGHLQIAMYVYQHLLPMAKQLNHELHVSLLPNARSPFKKQSTDPKHRLAMLKLATTNTPIQIDELELWQAPPVYTIDSVRTLRQRYPHDRLIFIIGMDSALSLTKWKEGLGLTDYVNLWIFNRDSLPDINVDTKTNINDHNLSENTPNLVDENHITQNVTELQSQLPTALQCLVIGSPTELIMPNVQTQINNSALKNNYQGHIYIDPRPVTAVSSTQVRQKLQKIPHVLNIKHTAETQITSLQPINDIMCNTELNPLAKWLNPAVYQYIIAHQLYSAAQFR